MRDSGMSLSLEEVELDMEKRDRSDEGRTLAPLRCAPDAIRVDCTEMNVEEVVKTMLSYIGGLTRRS